MIAIDTYINLIINHRLDKCGEPFKLDIDQSNITNNDYIQFIALYHKLSYDEVRSYISKKCTYSFTDIDSVIAESLDEIRNKIRNKNILKEPIDKLNIDNDFNDKPKTKLHTFLI